MTAHTIGVCAALGVAVSLLGCGSVGPSTRTEKPNSEVATRTPRCEPSLVLECESVCISGDWSACEVAGIGYLNGDHITQDLARARLLLRRSCEQEQPLACASYAKMALDQQGVTLSQQQLETYLENGCEAGDMDACVRRGNQWLSLPASRETLHRSTELWQRACDSGNAEGCLELGVSAKTGRAGAAKDAIKAAKLLTQACDARIGRGCFELGHLQLVPGTPTSDARSGMMHVTQACGQSYQAACSLLGDAYQYGKGVPRDLSQARTLHEQACLASIMESCVALAELSSDAPDEQLKLFTRGCDAKIPSACFNQAKLLEARSKEHALSHEETVAVEDAYRMACDQGLAESCGHLGLLLRSAVSLKQRSLAAKYLQTGCDTGQLPEACLTLGQWLVAGEPIPRDGARAAKLLGPLCARGTSDACVSLARVTLFGYGMPANVLGATDLYAQACDAGNQSACLKLAEQQWLGLGGVKKTPANAVAVFKSQCDSSVEDACLDLGYAYQQGVGITRDLPKARALFEAPCKAGRQNACAYLGNLLALSRGGDRETGHSLLVSSCDSASGKGCWFLADQPSVTPEQRAQYLSRACVLEVPEACTVQNAARANR